MNRTAWSLELNSDGQHQNVSNTLSKLNITWCVSFLRHLSKTENKTRYSGLETFSEENNFQNYCIETLQRFHLYMRPYVLPWWQQFLWATIFGVMISMATGGNIIVAWIVVAHRKMRTVTNYFLLNLAIADLLLADFNAIFNFVYLLGSHWPFASVYCTISNFIAYLTVSTSVFSIAALSMDRYMAIVRPLSPRMSKKTALLVTALIWLSGILLALPTLLYSTTRTYHYAIGGDRTLCYLLWPNGRLSEDDYIYNVFFLIFTYIIPVAAMVITYTKMGLVLWGSRAIGETTEHQRNIVLSKRRVVRMLIAVALVFTICWLPYHVYFIYTYHQPEILQTDYIQHVYLVFYWLAMSNSTYNPVVYYCMNTRFKRYFCKVLCCCRKTTDQKCPGKSSVEGTASKLRSFTRKTFLRKSTFSQPIPLRNMKTNCPIDDV